MELLKLDVWKRMNPVSLDEMSEIRLMNRIDTKFLIREDMLPELLEEIQEDYRVQVVGGVPVAHYKTLYYDTPDTEMYNSHHNEKLTRQKIRTRTYVESQISFLEVKRKNNKGRTSKDRIRISNEEVGNICENQDAMTFLLEKSTISGTELVPQLLNDFERITLVNNAKTERLTIDAHIRFCNMQTGIQKDIPDLVVVELKQDGRYPSVFKNRLMECKVLPKSFSKYCLGTIVTNPHVKSNRFKNKLRYINKLTDSEK
jgi:hypothetical protein